MVIETQPSPLQARLQHTILFTEKRDQVLVLTLSPVAQDREDELKRIHGVKSTSGALDPLWDTTGSIRLFLATNNVFDKDAYG